MTPLPVIPGVIRAAFRWTSPNFTRAAVNVMHFREASEDIDALWASIDANVTAAMWNQTHSNNAIVDVTFTTLNGISGSVVKTTGSPSKWKGNNTPGDVTAQVAALIKVSTASRGRSYRGRVYLPWVLESENDSGTYNSTARTAQTTAWNTFRTAMAAANHELGIASYKLAQFAPATQCTAEILLATQRLRQPRP